MAILNYTTTIDAYKTVAEIEHILMAHNAKSVLKNYENGSITGLDSEIAVRRRKYSIHVKRAIRLRV